MNKQTGPEHGEVLGQTVSGVETAALQWLEALTAPTPLLHAVVPAQRTEHAHRDVDGTTISQGRVQADRDRRLCPIQTVVEDKLHNPM